MRTARAMLMNFCSVNSPRCEILIWVCKVFCLFQQTFAYEKVKGNIMKRQKTSPLKHFSLAIYSRKWNHVPFQIPDQFKSYLENYYIFKNLTCIVQIMIYFKKVSSSSRATCSSILRVSRNVSRGEGLLIRVTV